MSDPELAEIRADIVVTKADFASAKIARNEPLILMYGNLLTELQKKENLLLTGAGNLILHDSNHS